MKFFKTIQKATLLLLVAISSVSVSAQTVDLIANVNATPPLSIGQTFTYSLEAIAGTTEYQGAQIYLEYNPAILQVNNLTPDNSVLNVPLANDTSTPGIIKYAAGSFAAVSGTTTMFTITFEVIGTTEDVMITHDLEENGNANGTAVANSSGENITGITNAIILATLETTENTLSNQLSIFPNPVKDVLNINLNQSNIEVKTIALYALDGKLVQKNYSMKEDTIRIDTSKLENAIYLLKITSIANEIATYKILVNQ